MDGLSFDILKKITLTKRYFPEKVLSFMAP